MPVITPGLFPSVMPSIISVGPEKPGSSPGQIGRPGPARAGLSRLRPAFQRTENRQPPPVVISALAVPWESGIGVTGATVTSVVTWEALLGVFSPLLVSWESAYFGTPATTFGVRGQIGNRPGGQIGSPGPARAGLSRLRPQFRFFEWRQSFVTVSSSLEIPWASQGSILQAAPTPWEAFTTQTATASALAAPWESLVKFAAALTTPWETAGPASVYLRLYASVLQSIAVRPLILGRSEGQIGHPGPGPAGFSRFRETFAPRQQPRVSGGPVAGTLAAPWEAGGMAAQTRLVAYEALLGLRPALAGPWEAGGTSLSARLAPWESVTPLSRITLTAWESILRATQTSVSPWEGLTRSWSDLTALWEAQSTQTAVARTWLAFWEALGLIVPAPTTLTPYESVTTLRQSQLSPWSSLNSPMATALSRWESLGILSASQLTIWASLQRLAQILAAPWEASIVVPAVPATQTALTPWESLFGARSLIVSPWEARHYQASVVSAPWEAMVGLHVLNPALWESILSSRQSTAALWEALLGVRGTQLAPWEAHGALVQLIQLVDLLGHVSTIADLEAFISTINKIRGKD